MQTLLYDHTFAGLLSAIFDVYEYKYADVHIIPATQAQAGLFGSVHTVHTDEGKALRVWNGLKKRLSHEALAAFYKTWLSEQQGVEDMLLRYARYAFAHAETIETDYSHPAVQYVIDTAKKVHREKHRMEAFVRFQLGSDGLYFATVEPDFNVLPLILPHFEKRYADQKWMIFDLKRKYGIYYDLHKTAFVDIAYDNDTDAVATTVLDETEAAWQQLWQKYFNSINIAARKNIKLHLRHMPYRYWKYLTEKQLNR